MDSDPAAVPAGQTRTLGTVCQYVLLKTILPWCQSWFGFGGGAMAYLLLGAVITAVGLG